jgi:hypothetical protein
MVEGWRITTRGRGGPFRGNVEASFVSDAKESVPESAEGPASVGVFERGTGGGLPGISVKVTEDGEARIGDRSSEASLTE